jgi:mono/diheme cytochrome c family protein
VRTPANVRTARLVLTGLGLLLGACGAGRRGEPLVGRMNLSDPAIAHGQIVYARACDHCHPGGEGGLGPSLNDKPLPVWLMRLQVRHGLGVMPEFPEDVLSDTDVDDLLAYIKARRAMEPPDVVDQ